MYLGYYIRVPCCRKLPDEHEEVQVLFRGSLVLAEGLLKPSEAVARFSWVGQSEKGGCNCNTETET